MEQEPIFKSVWLTVFCMIAVLVLMFYSLFIVLNPSFFFRAKAAEPPIAKTGNKNTWAAPDTLSIPDTYEGNLILYGRELIKHTSVYLGPKGKVAHISNGMNCQNCHLEAGTKFFGNNYSAVASTYPKLRERSGTIESIEKRVNDCIERSLNGKAIANDSKEMSAFVSYIKWVGKDVEQNISPK